MVERERATPRIPPSIVGSRIAPPLALPSLLTLVMPTTVEGTTLDNVAVLVADADAVVSLVADGVY